MKLSFTAPARRSQLSTTTLYLSTISILSRKENNSFHMRGASALLPAANKFKTIYPEIESWVATLTPKKQTNNEIGKGKLMTKEKIEPIVVFSKPPTIPPVIGPLVLFSLFEAWSSRDSDG